VHVALAQVRGATRSARAGVLAELQRKESTARVSIQSIIDGIEQTRVRVAQENAAAFSSVSRALVRHYADLVPALELDVTTEDPEVLDPARTVFRVRARGSDGAWRSGLHELSGGQARVHVDSHLGIGSNHA